MAAHVEHTFEAGFLLDEERLRKIRSILQSRLTPTISGFEPTYKVFRGDTYSYSTTAIEHVLGEDNEGWKAVTRLAVRAARDGTLELVLAFSKDGVELNIDGEDRDEVFLLFTDLREYIGAQVAVAPRWSRKKANLINVAMMFVAFTLLAASLIWADAKDHANAATVARALDLPDTALSAKIDALLRAHSSARTPNASLFVGMLALMSLAFVSGALELPWRLTRWLYPSNVFLLGKARSAYDRRRELVSKLLWAVVIGIAVSAVGSWIVWQLTTRP